MLRFGSLAGLGIIIVGTVAAAAIIASVVSTYARETSGMTERWSGKTVAQRDCGQGIPTQQLAGTIAPDANPCAITADDTDGDGISNDEEKTYGTDPNNPDTDGDGWGDGVEILNGTSPTDKTSFPKFDTNISSSTSHPTLGGSRDNPNDHDNDGLSNDEERILGTDPTNPDTDGDGVSDGTEIIKGTDPKDPTNGGLQTPPPTPGPPHIPQLILDKLYKTVQSGDQWRHATEVRLGDVTNFRIHAEVINEGGTHTLIIEDYLPGGLTYLSGTTSTNNSEPVSLPYSQLRHQEIVIAAVGRTIIDLAFSTKVVNTGNYENLVTMFEEGKSARMTDKAFVIVHSLEPGDSIGGGFGQVCTICNFYKEGRAPGDTGWTTHVKANPGDRVEFHIVAEGSITADGQAVTIQLKDTLPDGLTYVKGSGQLFKNEQEQAPPADNWISTGLSLASGAPHTAYEIKFFVKVEAGASFSLTNTARADTFGGDQPNSRISATEVSSKP